MNDNDLVEAIKQEYPDLPPEIIDLIQNQKNTLEAKDSEIERLNQILLNFKRERFGQHSEKIKYIISEYDQPSLFNEAEVTQEETATEPSAESIKTVVNAYERKKKRTKDELHKGLPEVEVVHDVPESALTDEAGNKYTYMATERVRSEIEIIPRQMRILVHSRKVYSCTITEEGIEKTLFLKAEVPPSVIPHSDASPSSVADVMVQKYVSGIPLYRQAQSWNRNGIDIRRNTLSNWIIVATRDWLKPIYSAYINTLLKEPVIHADETPVQVLKEPDKDPTSKSMMWVYASSARGEHPIRIFNYQDSRSGDCPKEFLSGFNGILVSDGYSGYNKLEEVTRAGCWAHLRRRFREAMPPGATPENSKAAVGLKFCTRLFSIEKRLRDLPSDERLSARQEQCKPILDEFWEWLDTLSIAGGSKLAEAVTYARNQKPYLCTFLNHGNVDISNNLVENAIRPFVIGRKNWLFCDSPKGAESSAIVYSLVETAKANGIDPYRYLLFLLSELPASYGKLTEEKIAQFMPWTDAAKEACSKVEIPA